MRGRITFRVALCRRYASTNRIPAKPSMRHPDPLVNSSNATATMLSDDLTFIHRPPPSAPTPLSYTTNPASPLLKPVSSNASSPLPPLLRTPAEEKPRMSDEDLAELRRLRSSNPTYYTRKRLANQFHCTQSFIGRMAPLSTQDHRIALAKRDEEHAKIRSQWGERKLIIRDTRKRRKEFW